MGTQFDNEPTIRYIGISGEPCHPSNILWTDEPWRGRVLYTGKQYLITKMLRNTHEIIR